MTPLPSFDNGKLKCEFNSFSDSFRRVSSVINVLQQEHLWNLNNHYLSFRSHSMKVSGKTPEQKPIIMQWRERKKNYK